MANEWNTHLESLKDRLSELNQTIDVIKSKVEKRPGLDAATQGIAGLISNNSDKSLAHYPVVLSNVLSDSAIGAIMLNSEGKFMMFNFTAQRILGIAYVSRMCGATDAERQEEPVSFLKADDSYFEERELPWKRVLEGVEVNNFRLKVKKDAINDVRWINISATPFLDASQTVSGGIVFLFDFTDEVNLETSINSLCGVIAGQISQVGNSQRELEQLANQLAQTGIQKILLEKGINSPEARAPEPIAVAPVPDLSQRARFQPETATEAVEERKKSEETPDALIERMASVAQEPEQARAQESQNQVKENTEVEDEAAPWPDEADAEDFNRPLWEEYGKGEEEAAQSWTKNLDAVVSEVIEQESASIASEAVNDFDDEDDIDDEDDEDDEVDDIDEDYENNIESGLEVQQVNEIEVVQNEEEASQLAQESEVTEFTEVEEVSEAEEISDVSNIEDAEEVSDVTDLEETKEVSDVEAIAAEAVQEFETFEEVEDQEEFEQHAQTQEVAASEEFEQEQEVEGYPNMESLEQAINESEFEQSAQYEPEQTQISDSEFDEFEPIDEILSFDEKPQPVQEAISEPQSFEPSGIFESEQYIEPESPPPQAVLPAPETPPLMQQAMQSQEASQQNEDFSNIGSLVQKPTLKDTLLGGKKKRSTSASMHRIKALSGGTELGEEEEQSEQTVVDYGGEDADSDLNIKKVLVVDDIPVNQKLLLLHLRRLGYDADVASNGQEALDALANKEYELILMDCDMPVMNGFEAAARIRSNESYSHRRVPIIALTSYDREGDRERCIAAGMDDYITKGASRKELKEAIKRSVVSAREKGQAQSGEFNLDDIQADIAPLDIKAMLKLYGKEEVEEISRLFLSNMGTYIECMQLAIDEKDADSVVHFANAVKGPCAALGMKLMTRLTTDIISYSEAKDWTQVRVKYMRLKAVFVQTREELKKVCPDDSLLAK